MRRHENRRILKVGKNKHEDVSNQEGTEGVGAARPFFRTMSPEELLISGRERLAEDEAAGIETEQEQIPEDPRAGWPVLPAGRTIDDIVAGDRVFAFPIVAGDGTRKLMPGIVEKVVPYHIPPHSPRAVNEGSPGFANIHFDEYPWRVVGLDLVGALVPPPDLPLLLYLLDVIGLGHAGDCNGAGGPPGGGKFFGRGAVAQLAEHLHGMQGVRGSNPLSSTRNPQS